MRIGHCIRLQPAVGLLVLAIALPAACSEAAREPREAAEIAAASTARTYEVRGEVTRVAPAPENSLYVRHEAIPGFVDIDGERVGMDSMTMPFPLGEGVTAEGVEAGDKVRFTLEVDWEGDPAYRIVRVEELAADTVLDFGARRPAEDETSSQ